MFLFTWEDDNNEIRFEGIKAYDSNGNIIFEDFRWR